MDEFVQSHFIDLKDTQSILTKRVTRLILILIHQRMIDHILADEGKYEKDSYALEYELKKTPTLIMRDMINQLVLSTNIILLSILMYLYPDMNYTNCLPFVAYLPSIFLTEDKIKTSRDFQLCLMVLTYFPQSFLTTLILKN